MSSEALKLEDVLPYMRMGAIAIDNEGRKWRCYADHALHCFDGKHWISEMHAPLGGWTIEETSTAVWPKNSLGWAIVHAGPAGSVCRRGGRDRMPVSYVTGLIYHKLDWEVAK